MNEGWSNGDGRGLRVALAAAGAIALSAPAGAWAGGTSIVPGRSIGPVVLGQDRFTVEAAHGPGVVLRRTPNPGLPGGSPNTDVVLVRYPSLAVTVRFATDEASSPAVRIVTGWDAYRTSRGIGVGSTTAALRRAHPGAVCRPALCRIGAPARGRAITRFWLAGGRVRLVEVTRSARPG